MLVIPLVAGARNLHAHQDEIIDSRQQVLDSLLLRINHKQKTLRKKIGEFNIEAYITGLSQCEKQGLAAKHFPHLLPFQTNKKSDIAFEAIIQASYHWPGGIKFSCKTINSTSRRKSRMMLKDYYQAMLPGLEIREYEDQSSGKFHVLPFSEEGLQSYKYNFTEITDSLRDEFFQQGVLLDSSSCIIAFEPLRQHHTMLSGHLVIDSTHLEVIGFHAKGRIDMATIESHVLFRPDSTLNEIFPYLNRTKIHYNYGGSRATNSFTSLYKFKSIQSLDSIRQEKHPRINLSSTYETIDMDEADFDTIRPAILSPVIDSILYTPEVVEPRKHHKKNAVFTFSEHMVEGGHFGDENNRFRLYGPLDPATFGYDRIDGFSLNERIRWTKVFRDKSSLRINAQFGFAFRIKEFRYRTNIDWTFMPKIRQGISISFERSNTGVSSKYIDKINQALKDKKDTIDFYGLGIDYFQLYELRMEHHTEIRTGLNIFTGIQYNYRKPVKHGKMAVSVEHREELYGQDFSDFAPYIRLEWTPRQYYYFEGRRKIYIAGHTPTFILEATKAFPNVWGTNSDYGRVELDVTQNLQVAPKRHISYRLGTGAFFNQQDEYFINYHYFTRRFYPATWQDNHMGGVFQLLDQYWFNTSPSYFRAHAMYETPYGLVHRGLGPLSKFIIKERAYINLLSAEGKKFYSELGYGIANNYINLGFFVGFQRADFYKFGVKIKIELEKHL